MEDRFGVLCEDREEQKPPLPPPFKGSADSAAAQRRLPELVLIASSTGGPSALEKILSALPAAFPAPVLIVQHMLPSLMEAWAQELNKKAGLQTRVAKNGEVVSAGTAYIAPGGLHMRLDAAKRIVLDGGPMMNGVRPAADALFLSVAGALPQAGVLAVILTGMGRDGTKGLISLKENRNCFCMAQSEQTCVVYGMPRAAVECGLADTVLDLGEIAGAIERFRFSAAGMKTFR